MDDDGYPEDAELDRIRNWSNDDCQGVLIYIQGLWYYPDAAKVLTEFDDDKGLFYRFATGGWSGNESLIYALKENVNFIWMLTWVLSKRGGLYIFEVPPKQVDGTWAKEAPRG